MTELQKFTVGRLLIGYNIAGNSKYGYRLRNPDHQVCRKFSYSTFSSFKHLLSKRGGVFMINKSKVRQMHGKSWIKREYNSIQKNSGKFLLQKFSDR